MDPTLTGIALLIPSMLCAVLPMLGFLALIWALDRYEREPIWLLVLTFLWGAIGGVLFGIANSYTLMTPMMVAGASSTVQDAVGATFIAPLAEEPAKAIFLAIILWNRSFDDMTDGFVYGAASGLGFGMTENFMYFESIAFSGDLETWLKTVVIRTLYSALMHAAATSMVGAALGFARFRGCLALLVCGFGGLILAMSMHATWNGLITLDTLWGGEGIYQMLDYILFPLEVLVLFGVFQLCLLEEKFTIRHELDEEVVTGLIPSEHPAILSSWFRRRATDWLPAGVDHARYVAAATSLALRKKQLRLTGPHHEFYRDEVYRLRRQVQLLLERGKKASEVKR
jgi:RsiW-degrading membrane proteinase PrsW (M82 family)